MDYLFEITNQPETKFIKRIIHNERVCTPDEYFKYFEVEVSSCDLCENPARLRELMTCAICGYEICEKCLKDSFTPEFQRTYYGTFEFIVHPKFIDGKQTSVVDYQGKKYRIRRCVFYCIDCCENQL